MDKSLIDNVCEQGTLGFLKVGPHIKRTEGPSTGGKGVQTQH